MIRVQSRDLMATCECCDESVSCRCSGEKSTELDEKLEHARWVRMPYVATRRPGTKYLCHKCAQEVAEVVLGRSAPTSADFAGATS